MYAKWTRSYAIEDHAERVIVGIEEVRVHVEGDRGRRVTEHPLQGFHVRAEAHREACGRVAQFVRSQPGLADVSRCSIRGGRPLPRIREPLRAPRNTRSWTPRPATRTASSLRIDLATGTLRAS